MKPLRWTVATTPGSPVVIAPTSMAQPVAERNPDATAPRIAMMPANTILTSGSWASSPRLYGRPHPRAAPQAAPTKIRHTMCKRRGPGMVGTFLRAGQPLESRRSRVVGPEEGVRAVQDGRVGARGVIGDLDLPGY